MHTHKAMQCMMVYMQAVQTVIESTSVELDLDSSGPVYLERRALMDS